MSTGYQKRHSHLSARFKKTDVEQVTRAIASVQEAIAPVWPLRDFVAVNPYGGFSDQKFLDARKRLQSLSDCETLMPLAYYRERFQRGKFGLDELGQAVDEMVEDRIPGAESLNANAIYKLLESETGLATKRSSDSKGKRDKQRLRLASQYDDRSAGTNWAETITEEIGKHCSAHFDEGQASWVSPYRDQPLYQAWRSMAQLDRNVEVLGLKGFRAFVAELPTTPEAAIFALLDRAGIPQNQWTDYLLCVAFATPGWSAWTKFKTVESNKQGEERPDFAGLLAMRLAYEVALGEFLGIKIDHAANDSGNSVVDYSDDALLGMALLRANEIGFRSRVVDGIQSALREGRDSTSAATSSNGSTELKPNGLQRKLAQMVFCIDVRSERIRRNLEQASLGIETFGFAGFFGLPFEYVRLGDEAGTNQLPVLLDPQFKVYEDIQPLGPDSAPVRHHVQRDHNPALAESLGKRSRIRSLRSIWKSFQTSSFSCFAFVESNGFLYIKSFLDRLLRRPSTATEFDGVAAADSDRMGPGFDQLCQQGITTSDQADMAESILKGIGITEDFANLVVFCGHGSCTENNPLQAGLDCGACAGHSGEANARFAAALLNKSYVRKKLAERGIDIPKSTHFLAGLHNTTTDEIKFFDLENLPEASRGFLSELQTNVSAASQSTRQERMKVLPGPDERSLIQRSLDWSEVRPEWGLTGNAAFVIGPRDLTKTFSLRGESFLHSYDYRKDPEGALLEQIMTAPLVVANWINMQYFASTVDQKNFGSGTKTIHNVVGKFGILSGNGGDLTTGLPWESIHNGESYQHDPMRLLTVIEAPREWIERILSAHQNVRELVVNGWLNLVVIDNQEFHRFTENSEWRQLQAGLPSEVFQSA